MKKRVFALLLAAVSVLMLFGCTQTPETTAGVKTGQAITISKSTGINYCMGMLTADEDDDLLDPCSWKKERWPVLKSDWEKGVYGPGHNSFTKDEKGNDILVFHARTEPEIIGNPLYNPNRHAMLQRIRWSDEKPIFSFDNE